MQLKVYTLVAVLGLGIGLLAFPAGVATTAGLVDVAGGDAGTVDATDLAIAGSELPAWKAMTWQFMAAQLVELESRHGPGTNFEPLDRTTGSTAAFTSHHRLSPPPWLYAVPALVLAASGGLAAAASTRLLGRPPGLGGGAFVAAGYAPAALGAMVASRHATPLAGVDLFVWPDPLSTFVRPGVYAVAFGALGSGGYRVWHAART